MRFSTWSLLLLFSLVAVVLATWRFCYVQWPGITLAVSLGLICGVYTWLMILGLSTQGLPKNAGIILGGVLIGIVALCLYRWSPSPVATLVGFVAMWVVYYLTRQFGATVLRWAGVRSE